MTTTGEQQTVYTLPILPATATMFDAIDFGAYTPRGYDSTRISGHIRGLEIRYLQEGQWLCKRCEGSGTTFVIRDAQGQELGRIFKPSQDYGHALVFRPTTTHKS